MSDSRVDCMRKVSINQRRDENWYFYSGLRTFFHVQRSIHLVNVYDSDDWWMRHRGNIEINSPSLIALTYHGFDGIHFEKLVSLRG